jgi:trehalose 6-phosphate phosphatase
MPTWPCRHSRYCGWRAARSGRASNPPPRHLGGFPRGTLASTAILGYRRRWTPLPEPLRSSQQLAPALARRPFGLLTDLDGTLSPMAPTPDQAFVPAGILGLLRGLARQTLVAVVSGRDLPDLKRKAPIDGAAFVGLHGAAFSINGRDFLAPEAEPYRAPTAAAARELAGLSHNGEIYVEQKSVGIALHYRQARDSGDARARILAAIAASPAAQRFDVHEGIRLVELRPPVGITKGTAVAALVERFALESLVYLGDDRTDLDAFAAARRFRTGGLAAYAIAVVHADSSPQIAASADFTLDDVAGVERLLTQLAAGLGRSG